MILSSRMKGENNTLTKSEKIVIMICSWILCDLFLDFMRPVPRFYVICSCILCDLFLMLDKVL